MAKLATLGLTNEQAEAVAGMLCEVEEATAAQAEAVIEKSRAKTRERVQKWRLTHPSNVTERYEALPDVTKRLVREPARVEDKPLPTEIEPLKKEKKEGRSTRLSSDWILPVEWRADARAEGIPENMIDRLAVDMRDWSLSSPNGAKRDWRATWRAWCRRKADELAKQREGPPQKSGRPDHFKNFASEIEDGQVGDHRSGIGHRNDASGLPVRAIQHHG